jgi:hypothetical protein
LRFWIREITILVHVRGVPLRVFLAVGGSCMKVSSSGGSSLNETNWAISARVLAWKVHVRLMTTGIILTSAFRVP